MKKINLIASFLILIIFTFAEAGEGGIKYYSEDEVRKMGIVVDGGSLGIGEYQLDLESNRVHLEEFSVEFSEVVLEKEGKNYYNSFFIDEVSKLHEKKHLRKRIISLSPGITEKVYALGLGERLIGRTIYCKYPDEAKKVEAVGSMLEPSLEKVIVKNPGIVLMASHYNKGFVEQLKRVGIEYRVYKTPESLSEMHENLIDLGMELGVEARARVLAASFRSKAEGYRLKSEKNKKSPSVYYALGTGRTEYTAGGNTFIGDIITHSGGKNIAQSKKGWRFTLEELISKDPEFIIGSKKDMDILRSEKKYSLLRAVRENKLVEVDTDIYNLPGVRAVNEGIPLMHQAIYNEN